jgi:predicted TIM-barrel fold metal-dependent hydrolase
VGEDRAGRIDVHHHIVPPAWGDWLRDRRPPDSWLAANGLETYTMVIPPWSPESALAVMDAHGVEAAVLALSLPGVHMGDDGEARELARGVNEWTAGCVRERPERFGFFATLTLPDLEGAVAEATHALDELGADGVMLPSSASGVYLGDPSLDPLMACLEERAAVVLVHPGFLPARRMPGMQPGITDFPLETTRAAVNLVAHGAMRRYPRLRIVLAHGGGYLPYGCHRFAHLTPPSEHGPGSPEEFLEDVRGFWFDTALASSPAALPSLLAVADPGRIVFGTDSPYAPPTAIRAFTDALDAYPLEPRTRAAIDRGNAEQLFPRLRRGRHA